MRERLQKVLAHHGLGSRRHCEAIIADGRVVVDGAVAHLGQSVDPDANIVVDGTRLRRVQPAVYVLLHKPAGCVTTVSDPQGRPTVMQFVQQVTERVYPVGRLDFDSEGLLLFTNDGELTYTLTHPRHAVVKVYEVDVHGRLNASHLSDLRRGVHLDDGLTAPADVELLSPLGQDTVRLRIGIHEGRNRQIRRMVAAVGGKVERLVRIAIGPLQLGSLAAGHLRWLTRPEVNDLIAACRPPDATKR